MKSSSLIVNVILFISSINDTIAVEEGNKATDGHFKYQVAILTWLGDHICGGGIMDEIHILTAAHCITGRRLKELVIGAGNVNSNDLHRIFKTISHIDIHPGYVHDVLIPDKSSHLENRINNIAVITIKHPFVWSDGLAPLALPVTDFHECDVGIFAGWGENEQDTNFSETLQWTYQRVLGPDLCGAADYYHFIDQFCAIAPPLFGFLSYGDDGGPLVQGGVIIGIADLVFVDTSPYQRFTNVYYHRDFLSNITSPYPVVANMRIVWYPKD